MNPYGADPSKGTINRKPVSRKPLRAEIDDSKHIPPPFTQNAAMNTAEDGSDDFRTDHYAIMMMPPQSTFATYQSPPAHSKNASTTVIEARPNVFPMDHSSVMMMPPSHSLGIYESISIASSPAPSFAETVSSQNSHPLQGISLFPTPAPGFAETVSSQSSHSPQGISPLPTPAVVQQATSFEAKPLAQNWQWYVDDRGNDFYVNRNQDLASRTHPSVIPPPEGRGPFPAIWEPRVSHSGRAFYVNLLDGRELWKDPRVAALFESSPLPSGWDWMEADDGRVFFVNTSTFEKVEQDPRLMNIPHIPMRLPKNWETYELDGKLEFVNLVTKEFTKMPPQIGPLVTETITTPERADKGVSLPSETAKYQPIRPQVARTKAPAPQSNIHSICCHCQRGIAYNDRFQRCVFCDLDVCQTCTTSGLHKSHKTTMMLLRTVDRTLYDTRPCIHCQAVPHDWFSCPACHYSICRNCWNQHSGKISHYHSNKKCYLTRYVTPVAPWSGVDINLLTENATPHGQCCSNAIWGESISHCPKCLKPEYTETLVCLNCQQGMTWCVDCYEHLLTQSPGCRNHTSARIMYETTGVQNMAVEPNTLQCCDCNFRALPNAANGLTTSEQILIHIRHHSTHNSYRCKATSEVLKAMKAQAYQTCRRKAVRGGTIPTTNKTPAVRCERCKNTTKWKNVNICMSCFEVRTSPLLCRHCVQFVGSNHEHGVEDFICMGDPAIPDAALKIGWTAHRTERLRIWYRNTTVIQGKEKYTLIFDGSMAMRGPDDPIPESINSKAANGLSNQTVATGQPSVDGKRSSGGGFWKAVAQGKTGPELWEHANVDSPSAGPGTAAGALRVNEALKIIGYAINSIGDSNGSTSESTASAAGSSASQGYYTNLPMR